MFSANLRAAREKAGFSQTQLANILNISVSTYRNYENTNREPDYRTLVRISNTLNFSTDFLLGKVNGTQNGMLLANDKEIEIINLYRQLDDEGKGEVKGLMKGILKFQDKSSSRFQQRVSP